MSELTPEGASNFSGELLDGIIALHSGERVVRAEDLRRLGDKILRKTNALALTNTDVVSDRFISNVNNVAYAGLRTLSWGLTRPSVRKPDTDEYLGHMNGLFTAVYSIGRMVGKYRIDNGQEQGYTPQTLPAERNDFLNTAHFVFDTMSKNLLPLAAMNEYDLFREPLERVASGAPYAMAALIEGNGNFLPVDAEGEDRLRLLGGSFLQLVGLALTNRYKL